MLARLIAREEGFGIAGTLPTRNHNPGDLRHSPHSQHSADNPNGIGQIDTDADGWDDLERQLQLYAGRGLTLREMIVNYYAPKNENDPEKYLLDICRQLGVDPSCTVAQALEIP